MTVKQFFDTNVLIYAFDSSEPLKQQIAIDRVGEAVRSQSGVISTQVMG